MGAITADLTLDHLTPVYHGEHGLRTLMELVRSYLTITKDLARVTIRTDRLQFRGHESAAVSESSLG